MVSCMTMHTFRGKNIAIFEVQNTVNQQILAAILCGELRVFANICRANIRKLR